MLTLFVGGLAAVVMSGCVAPDEDPPTRAGPKPDPTQLPTTIPELECPPADPLPSTVTDYIESPDDPSSPREALDRYFLVMGFNVGAERFEPVSRASNWGYETWALEKQEKIRALAGIRQGRLGGWYVGSFDSCFAWEQAHLNGAPGPS